jgi:pimeloyl-ACP methyl ester carboxylesterase
MTTTHTSATRRGAAALTLSAILAWAVVPDAYGKSPPEQPPAHWGPVSISLEDVPYPYAVEFVDMVLQGQQVRMGYMDVAPDGDANGQVAVLFHGANYFGLYWENTIDALRNAGFRVIVVDQIGYGKSSKPILEYSISFHADNAIALLQHLEIDRAAMIGHSMGGMVATRVAYAYPEATSHLVLVNPIGLTAPADAASTTPPTRADLDRDYDAALGTIRRHVLEWQDEYLEFVRIHYGWTLSGDWPRLAMIRTLNGFAIRTDPVVPNWPHIQAPTLFISGAEDGPDFPERARNAVETIPDAYLVLFPGVGHNPHWEAPELLHPPLIEFLRTGTAPADVMRALD